MKIKLNLELGKTENFPLAYNKLNKPFLNFFGVPVKIKIISNVLEKNKKIEERYYFCFENEDQSIFAFCLL